MSIGITPGTKPELAWLTDQMWADADLNEREVLWAAWFCDVAKVREIPKNANTGPWVNVFLHTAGVTPGLPWCASFEDYLAYCVERPHRVHGAAAVWQWAHSPLLTHVTDPKRGDLAYWLNPDHHGHIMRVLTVDAQHIHCIEGNAQPGDSGDQREGGGVYRRVRPRSSNIKFLRWK